MKTIPLQWLSVNDISLALLLLNTLYSL